MMQNSVEKKWNTVFLSLEPHLSLVGRNMWAYIMQWLLLELMDRLIFLTGKFLEARDIWLGFWKMKNEKYYKENNFSTRNTEPYTESWKLEPEQNVRTGQKNRDS